MVEMSRVTAKEAAKSIRPGTVKTVELLFQTSGGHVALVHHCSGYCARCQEGFEL